MKTARGSIRPRATSARRTSCSPRSARSTRATRGSGCRFRSKSPQCPGQSGPGVSLRAYQMTPRSRRRSRAPAASSKILVRYSAWRSGPTVRPDGCPPDAQPTSVIQIGLDPSPARSSRLLQLLRPRQGALGVGGVRVHGGLVEELRGAMPVKIGNEGGHVDAVRRREEASEQDVSVGICALHRIVEGAQHSQVALGVRRGLPEVDGVRLVPELPVGDRPQRQLGVLLSRTCRRTRSVRPPPARKR